MSRYISYDAVNATEFVFNEERGLHEAVPILPETVDVAVDMVGEDIRLIVGHGPRDDVYLSVEEARKVLNALAWAVDEAERRSA